MVLVNSCFATMEIDACGSCCSLLFNGYVESLRPPPVQASSLWPTATPSLLAARSSARPLRCPTCSSPLPDLLFLGRGIDNSEDRLGAWKQPHRTAEKTERGWIRRLERKIEG